MSINNIRQRKLFKKKGVSLNQLLIDTSRSDDEKENQCNLKTEISQNIEAYTSRPTLQSNPALKQLNFLQNKINKQEAITKKYFQQMEYLEEHYKGVMNKQCQKYEMRRNQVLSRLAKQEERNKQTELTNQKLIQAVIGFLINKSCERKLGDGNERENYIVQTNRTKGTEINKNYNTEQQNSNSIQNTMHFIQLLKSEIKQRRSAWTKFNIRPKDQKLITEQSHNPPTEQTLDLGIKLSKFQQRQSQSILLDNSFVL